MTQSEEIRQELFTLNKSRLKILAAKALDRGLEANQFAVICIDVDDSTWTEEVDMLMPQHDWQQYRNRGERPVARGSVTKVFCDYIGEVVPGIASALLKDVPYDHVQAIVLGSGGASLYFIRPVINVK